MQEPNDALTRPVTGSASQAEARVNRRPRPIRATGEVCLIVSVALVTAVLVGYSTAWSPWAFSDSAAYLAVGANVADGTGLGVLSPSGRFRPLTHYPPLYPLALSGPIALGASPLDSARWLGVASAISLVGMAGILMRAATRSGLVAALAALVLVSSPVLMFTHTGAMSESLCIALGTTSLLLVALDVEDQRSARLLLAGVLAGLAAITRYAGIAYALAGGLAVLVLEKGSLGSRLRGLLMFAASALGPVLLWFFWVAAIGEPARVYRFEAWPSWPALQVFREHVLDIVWRWLPIVGAETPPAYRARQYAAAGAALALAALSILTQLRGRDRQTEAGRSGAVRLTIVWMLFVGAYLVVLAGTWLYAIPGPDLNDRVLSPLVPALVIALLASLWLMRWVLGPRAAVTLVSIAAGLMVWAWAPSTLAVAQHLHEDGLGYSSRAWRTSPTLAAILTVPADVALISNEPSAVLLNTGRFPYDVSERYRSEPLDAPGRFGDDLGDPGQVAFRAGGRLVLFHTLYWQLHPLYGDRTSDRLEVLTAGLVLVQAFPDGAIYAYPEEDG